MPNPINAILPPCRLNVFLAREAPVGVILRRGPAKWVQLIKWNLADDTFESGQWFHGRIYEEACDISPDKTKFIYCARKENPKTHADTEIGYCWSALSKPPYFTAFVVWRAGGNWDGGGVFLSDTVLSLHSDWPDYPERLVPKKGELPSDLTVVAEKPKINQPLPLRRLELEGWEHIQEWRGEIIDGKRHTNQPGIYEKKKPLSRNALLMRCASHDITSYAVKMPSQEIPVEWTDWDEHGRLVFTRDGKLFATDMEKGGIEEAIELADFNDSKPEPIEAPEWAKVWK